jgi:hypothetical protein
MSYCSYEWLSAFTFTGIYQRLAQEDSLPPRPPWATAWDGQHRKKRMEPNLVNAIHVVATINVTKESGQFQFVSPYEFAKLPVAKPTRANAQISVVLRVVAKDNSVIREYPVSFIEDQCRPRESDRTGVVDAIIENNEQASRLDLILNSRVVDVFKREHDVKPASKVQLSARGSVDGTAILISWSSASFKHGEAQSSGTTFTIEISEDGGKSWQCIGLGLKETEVAIDRTTVSGATDMQIRVTSTNGFSRQTTVKKLKAVEIRSALS